LIQGLIDEKERLLRELENARASKKTVENLGITEEGCFRHI
jgi:hypothetical protein